MTTRQDTAERLWLELTEGRQQAPNDEAKDLQKAKLAKLRQARLAKEAEDSARANLRAPKKARRKVS